MSKVSNNPTANEKVCAKIAAMTVRELLDFVLFSPEYLTDPYYQEFSDAVYERRRALGAEKPLIILELKRTASDTPVPSHGGPAVSVTWELRLNGVVIQQSYDRYHWSDREKAGLKAPVSMQKLLVELQAAIDGATLESEGDNE
ncbi:hypothetical protein [Brucella anthropi]|uniref:hypothetical protein n=1 Tax=Brucella anthropi TaxID=529 RepID=UPI00124C05C5|nr:hypothetical protein [Brucella anthropi]KAB2752344.1 hypothetical protein F9L05_04320 [Brucella anthropi]